ncbi:MAG: 3'(2'),5'-bisphosphate nucleotidase [Microcystaceae cyanobacterium]
MTYAKEREIAIATTRLASQLCDTIRQQQKALTIEKPDQSPVTIADFSAQAIICQGLSDDFPDDPIIAEEDANLLQQDNHTLGQVTQQVQTLLPDTTENKIINWINRGNGKIADRYWTLDPIDGTKGFIRGDQYAIALALVEKGRVKLGVVGCPALPWDFQKPEGDKGVLFVAVENQGTEMINLNTNESRKIKVNSPKPFSQLTRIESVETRHSDHYQQELFDQKMGMSNPVQKMDSLAKYAAIARGEVDIYLRIPLPHFITWKENIWDHAAGIILVEEAGGKVTDLTGKPLDFSVGIKMLNNYGIAASNGWNHSEVLKIISQLSPADDT